MAWRGPTKPTDPLLQTAAHRGNRAYWLRLRLPCARCKRAIDYDGPRYIVVNGRRRQNPRYLVVGHIVSRYEARLLGWTAEQINTLSNTQPECTACSNRSGAQLGQKVAAVKAAIRSPASRW